jgi:hypothetical protein
VQNEIVKRIISRMEGENNLKIRKLKGVSMMAVA